MTDSKYTSTRKILWLAPIFNHYKARFLNHLAEVENVELTVLSGSGRKGAGDKELEGAWGFQNVRVDVSKSKFGFSHAVRKALKKQFKDFDWILIPAEKKNLPLFIYALFLRRKHKGTKLFSYNHQYTKPKSGDSKSLDLFITKFFFKKLDRVIFYSQDICEKAISSNLVKAHKATWANNTIDTTEIEKNYSYTLPPDKPVTLVFIGRLNPNKRVGDLISFFNRITTNYPNKFKLEIIGDGPERNSVLRAQKMNSDIVWHGTLIDEEKIAPIMTRASLVFIPGLAGLSVNHAFAYGRPYATYKALRHGPEISYLVQNRNGFILDDNVELLEAFLNDRKKIEDFCNFAYETSKSISIERWLEQIMMALYE